MSTKSMLRSAILNTVLSPRVNNLRRRKTEWRRRATGQPHRVTAFLQIDDPYSYLLALCLPDLSEHYDVEIDWRLSQALGDRFLPRPDMLAEYAVEDCKRLAQELGLPFLDKGASPPVELRATLTDVVAAESEEFETKLRHVLTLYWRGDTEGADRRCSAGGNGGAGSRMIAESRALLQQLGHYSSAMLHYGGEWFWGVDRLHYLTDRLAELGAKKSTSQKLAAIEQMTRLNLPVKPPSAAQHLPTLEFFLSMRSPYSVLALHRVGALADAYGLDLKLRLVLPMVMRGMQVPRSKLLYIANDTMREAQSQNVPFGNLADPVGAGIERLYAVARYAASQNRERDFLLNAGVAIWAEGIDVATDKGLRKVTGRTGLFWPEAKDAMNDDSWRGAVDANRENMMDAGSWGVPTLRLGDYVVWGQDRIWLLARHIEDLCDTGDGILV